MLKPVHIRLLRVGACRHPECMAMRGGSYRPVNFPALCAVIQHPTFGNWLFDTGYSEHFRRATQVFPEKLYRWLTPVQLPESQWLVHQLDSLGLRPGDIDGVIVSHFHADHVAGLKDFPRARFVASQQEFQRLRGLTRVGGLVNAFLPQLIPEDFEQRLTSIQSLPSRALPYELHPFETARDVLGDGSLLGVELPGHTQHQVGLLARNTDGRIVFLVADASWSLRAIRELRMPHPLTRLLFDDTADYQATLRGLNRLSQSSLQVSIVPSHCEETAKEWLSHAG